MKRVKLEFKVGDAVTAVFLAVLSYMILANFGLFSFPQQVNRDFYKKAMQQEKEHRYNAAYYTYGRISKFYPAYSAVLLKQAECASAIGDEKTAIKKLKLLTIFCRTSPLYAQAEYNLGQVYYRSKKYKDAESHFLQASRVDETNKYSIASYYYLGQINKKNNLSKSIKYWKKYLSICPDGRFSTECIHELKVNNANLNSDDYANFAIAYYNSARYKEAKNYADIATLSKIWLYKAKIYNKLGLKASAESILFNGIRYYSSNLDKSQVRDAIDLFAKISESTKKEDLSKLSTISGKNNDYVLFKLAKSMPLNTALPLYSKIIKSYPNSDYLPDCFFSIAWANYLSGNYDNTINLTKKFLTEYEGDNIAPKAIFWMAKAYEQKSRNNKAAGLYKHILRKYPDSYFAFRATGRLRAIQNSSDYGWATISANQIDSEKYIQLCPYSDNELVGKYGNVIAELIAVGDVDLIPNVDKLDGYTQSWIYLQKGNTSKSIVSARDELLNATDKPDLSSPVWKLAYPIYYSDVINQNAENYGLDGYIILSLIREESYFSDRANSIVNAQGLMQLMPATANEVSNRLGFGSVSVRSLRNPSTNIKLGSAYLRQTKERFGGRTVFAVASYNGGPGAVSSWLKRSNTQDMDVFIESIPFPETKLYVEKVYRSYWNYIRIYSTDN